MDKRILTFYRKNYINYISKSKFIRMSLQYEFFEKYLPSTPIRILDAGCGCGRDTIHFIGLGYETFSVDLVPEFVESLSEFGIKNVYNFDLMNLPYENFFNAIWLNDVLPTFPIADYYELFHELSELLKDKGLVYIATRSGNNCYMPGDTPGLSFFAEKEDILIYSSKYFDILAMEAFNPESARLENPIWFQYVLRKK